MSFRFSAALGTSPSLWFDMQTNYDFAQAKRKKLPKITKLLTAAWAFDECAAGEISVAASTHFAYKNGKTGPLAEFRHGYDLLARGGVNGKVVVAIP